MYMGFWGTLFLGPGPAWPFWARPIFKGRYCSSYCSAKALHVWFFRRKWRVAYSSLLGSKLTPAKDATLMPCLPLQGTPWGPAGPLPCRSISRLGVLDVPHMEGRGTWEVGFSIVYLFFSAAICSSCRTTRQQQLSVSRMEKQDEKREKEKRTGESVAAG